MTSTIVIDPEHVLSKTRSGQLLLIQKPVANLLDRVITKTS